MVLYDLHIVAHIAEFFDLVRIARRIDAAIIIGFSVGRGQIQVVERAPVHPVIALIEHIHSRRVRLATACARRDARLVGQDLISAAGLQKQEWEQRQEEAEKGGGVWHSGNLEIDVQRRVQCATRHRIVGNHLVLLVKNIVDSER